MAGNGTDTKKRESKTDGGASRSDSPLAPTAGRPPDNHEAGDGGPGAPSGVGAIDVPPYPDLHLAIGGRGDPPQTVWDSGQMGG